MDGGERVGGRERERMVGCARGGRPAPAPGPQSRARRTGSGRGRAPDAAVDLRRRLRPCVGARVPSEAGTTGGSARLPLFLRLPPLPHRGLVPVALRPLRSALGPLASPPRHHPENQPSRAPAPRPPPGWRDVTSLLGKSPRLVLSRSAPALRAAGRRRTGAVTMALATKRSARARLASACQPAPPSYPRLASPVSRRSRSETPAAEAPGTAAAQHARRPRVVVGPVLAQSELAPLVAGPCPTAPGGHRGLAAVYRFLGSDTDLGASDPRGGSPPSRSATPRKKHAIDEDGARSFRWRTAALAGGFDSIQRKARRAFARQPFILSRPQLDFIPAVWTLKRYGRRSGGGGRPAP